MYYRHLRKCPLELPKPHGILYSVYMTQMNKMKTAIRPCPRTYDRVEVLAFADGTYGKHCVKEVTIMPSRHALPQPGWSYVKQWREINPEIVGVRFEYMNPRCDVYIAKR